MRKRALRAIPISKVYTGRIHEVAARDRNIRRVIATRKKRVDSKETLILDVYQASGRNRRDISLQFRVFCQKDDYITFDVEGNKWRTGALLYLVCRDSGWCEYWWNYSQLEFLSDRDAERAESTLRKWNRDHGEHGGRAAFILLHQYQQNVKNDRLMKKHKKETDIIDADMEGFGALPEDYQAFVEEQVFRDENYMFYSTEKKRAFCTSCKESFILEGGRLRHEASGICNDRDTVRHNRAVLCPCCSKCLVAKSEGMGRGNLAAVKWSVLVQPRGEDVLTRYFCHRKDFRKDFRNPKVTTHEGYRTVHRADRATDYMFGRYRSTGRMRWCYYRSSRSSLYPPAETAEPRSVTVYAANLREAVAGTCMKYSVPDLFIENVANKGRCSHSPWIIDHYFNSYRKHPFIEQLLKVGFNKMAGEFLNGHPDTSVTLHDGERSILGTLGIGKSQYNMLRRIGDPGMMDLEMLVYKPDLRWDEFEDLRWLQGDQCSDAYRKYVGLMRYTTLHKLRRYVGEQKITHAQDYFDYIGWLEKMGYDMRNAFNLFPKDFKKAHDGMSRQYMKFKDKQAREDARRFNRLVERLRREAAGAEAMNLHVEGLFVRLPGKLEELKKEGEVLHHCVGAYMEKVSKGETMIFFIRQKEEPEKPYYTLEWRGKVVQCRGMHNCDMTPEVKAFVEIFQEKMIEYANMPEAHRKAG